MPIKNGYTAPYGTVTNGVTKKPPQNLSNIQHFSPAMPNAKEINVHVCEKPKMK